MLHKAADWLDQNAMACFYKKYFGIECPGCGMQRSVAALLRGDVSESFMLYPALLPILFMLIFLCLHLIFKWKNGGTILKYTFIFTASIIVISFILKIINQHSS